MNKFFKRITGLEKLEQEKLKAEESKKQAEIAAEEERIAKLSPKEHATERGEIYIDAIKTHVDPNNISHGFFELDWNSFFIDELRRNGFGLDGDAEEEIVDRWFRELCIGVASEQNIDMTDRNAGYVNVTQITNNHSAIG